MHVLVWGTAILGVSVIPHLIYLAGITVGKKHDRINLANEYPKISVVISAYNEEQNIKARIKNLSDCNYLDMEIIFVDDCSNDGTLAAARKFLDYYFFESALIHNEKRLGTSASYNKAILEARNDVVVVTDADTLFDTSALHTIVSRLVSDNQIGAVTGELRPLPANGMVSELEQGYRSVYGKMCEWESAHDSTFNFNGALMAFRKSAVMQIHKRGADDANLAFAAIRNGYRAVYESNAIVYEELPESFKVQFRQKVRRATGILQSILGNRDLLRSERPFAWFYLVRMWMYLISPILFLVASILNPFILLIILITSIGRAFLINQVYLTVGGFRVGTDNTTWESTTSLKKQVKEELGIPYAIQDDDLR